MLVIAMVAVLLLSHCGQEPVKRQNAAEIEMSRHSAESGPAEEEAGTDQPQLPEEARERLEEENFHNLTTTGRYMLSMFSAKGIDSIIRIKLGSISPNDLITYGLKIKSDQEVAVTGCLSVDNVQLSCQNLGASSKWQAVEYMSARLSTRQIPRASSQAYLTIKGSGSGIFFIESISAYIYRDGARLWYNSLFNQFDFWAAKTFTASEAGQLPQQHGSLDFRANTRPAARVQPFEKAPNGLLRVLSPRPNQVLDLDGNLNFELQPVSGANGFLFSVWQNNQMVYENLRDERTLALGSHFGLSIANPHHSKLVAGPAQVMIRYKFLSQWSDAYSFQVNLTPDTWDVLGSQILDADRILAQDSYAECPGPKCVWPNSVAHGSSDPWISTNHDNIQAMRPRLLVINFANGISEDATDNLHREFPTAQLKQISERFLQQYALATKSKSSPGQAESFIQPQLLRIIDLRDGSRLPNSSLFPRGPRTSAGFPIVGYHQLYGDAYAHFWKVQQHGRFLSLKELIQRGIVHDVVMIANQVDAGKAADPSQVTSNILEVAFTAQAYDNSFKPIPGEYVRNGAPWARQKFTPAQLDEHIHNSIPWSGRSTRVFFLNPNAGVNNLMHAFIHELEFRYNESRVHSPGTPHHGKNVMPYMQPLFRKFADFDYSQKFGAHFDSLYAAGGQDYVYQGPIEQTVLNTPAGTARNYYAGCGNAHHAPGATEGYQYNVATVLMSFCDSFQKPNERLAAWSKYNYGGLRSMTIVGETLGWDGAFYINWFQSMPGPKNDRVDFSNKPMKNWYAFFYY